MATSKKKSAKKEAAYMNVRINNPNYNLIKDFCKDHGYKVGAFIETAAFNRMLREAGKA